MLEIWKSAESVSASTDTTPWTPTPTQKRENVWMRWSHWSGAWSEQRVNGRSRKYSKYYQRESSALTRWPGTPSLLYCTWPLSALTNPHWYISEVNWPPLTCWDKTATCLPFKIRMQTEGEGEVRSVEQHFPTESLLYLHECCLALLCRLDQIWGDFSGEVSQRSSQLCNSSWDKRISW